MYSLPSRSDRDVCFTSMSPSIRVLSGPCSSCAKPFPAIGTTSFCSTIRHKTFSASLDETVEGWGIHILRSPVRTPTANAHCERLIGSIRRECLDYLIPLNASHLRKTLREWICHYNAGRPHRSLGLAFLIESDTTRPSQSKQLDFPQFLLSPPKPILGGLHHEYRGETPA